ncbi:hypothetical protein [Flavobacterium sp. N3904]|uniref:hypothetical protein n=1 Tax=Flavobacterium sp. N3904 TaxID=2986835 RepID=UPI0022247BBE|nr:hypothetical protein [Flavobacterium sp. N3904]
MKKTELLFFEKRYLAGYDYYPFEEIFSSIKHLKKINSKNEKELRGILFTIIIQCTTYIEGMCGQILFSTIEHKINEFEKEFGKFDEDEGTFEVDEDKDFYIRILKNLERKIDESYFKDLETNWKLVYNQNIVEEIGKKDKELWKSINHLFTLRNAITHGHVLTIEYKPNRNDKYYEINVLAKYQKVYNFLTEKKLIETNAMGMVNIINQKVVEFYVGETKKFINALILSIPKNVEKYFAINKFQMIREKTL